MYQNQRKYKESLDQRQGDIRQKAKSNIRKAQSKIKLQYEQKSQEREIQSQMQVQIRKKNQIQQMENQVKKLNSKIQMERQLLRNKIISQQLEFQLKKNQIATKMSKKQIIIKKLSLLKQQPQSNSKIQIKKKIVSINEQNQSRKTFHQDQIKKKQKNITVNKSLQKLQKLREVWKKKKQYGDRVEKQYQNNRAKSAFSYLSHQNKHQHLISQKRLEQKKFLQQIKKPSLPTQIDAEKGRKYEVHRIQSSNNSPEQKIRLLNYLSQAELNRINLKQIRGRYQNMETLNCINRARTQIMLNLN